MHTCECSTCSSGTTTTTIIIVILGVIILHNNATAACSSNGTTVAGRTSGTTTAAPWHCTTICRTRASRCWFEFEPSCCCSLAPLLCKAAHGGSS